MKTLLVIGSLALAMCGVAARASDRSPITARTAAAGVQCAAVFSEPDEVERSPNRYQKYRRALSAFMKSHYEFAETVDFFPFKDADFMSVYVYNKRVKCDILLKDLRLAGLAEDNGRILSGDAARTAAAKSFSLN